MTDPASFLPLREPTFYILLSLVAGEKHGYAILKTVEEISSGAVQLSTGTLYEALSRLLDRGLIERLDEPSSPGPGKPRKVYRLNRHGRRLIQAEASRLDALAAAARRQLGDLWTEIALST